MPQQFDNVGDCVDAALRRVGKRIVLALPLALGNPCRWQMSSTGARSAMGRPS
jgi:hypothetical protein